MFKILVVDDNESDLFTITRLMKSFKSLYNLTCVQTASEAFHELKGTAFDCILLDYHLPDSDGSQFIKDFLDLSASPCAIILMTGQGNERIAAEVLKLGAQDYLSKTGLTTELLTRTIGFAIDKIQTQRREKEQEALLFAEKERLKVTLANLGDSVISIDNDGTIILLNRAAEELLNCSQEQAIRASLQNVFSPINSEDSKILSFSDILKVNEPILLPGIFSLSGKNNIEKFISINISPIYDKNKVKEGIVLVIHDITEQRKLLAAVQKNQKLESLGILAGGIAHDFNNLLAGIFGYIEIAQRAQTSEKQQKALTTALETMGRAKALTQQLLTFAKGGAPLKKVEPLFPFVTESVKFVLSGSNIELITSIEDDKIYVDFDKNQLGQVIDNIVINAKQAMLQGGKLTLKSSKIHLKNREIMEVKEGSYVCISFTDTGPGIPETVLPKIFDPFFSTKAAGNGLGLTTSYSIMKRHGGSLEVESKEGQGCTVSLLLPLINPTSNASCLPGYVSETSFKILLMDDEEVVRETSKILLEDLGYQILCAKDGESALEMFQEHKTKAAPFDLVIVDLTIPGKMGGLDFLKEVRKTAPTLPVIVCSGYAEAPAISNPQEYGFSYSLQKPYSRKELLEAIKHFQN